MSRIIITTHTELRVGRRVGNEVFVDTDELSKEDRKALDLWMKAYPDAVRPDPTPAQVEPVDTRPDVIERPALAVETVDPIKQMQNEDIRYQIVQQYAEERLIEYQIKQGLVDDSHNAALLRDWIQTYGQAYRLDVNVDRAIHALRPQLHWKPLSEFTKRLAGF
jgi:hypothetical protein